jgi:hypothetical protein
MDILEALHLIKENRDIQATDGKRNIFCNSYGAIQVKGTAGHFTLDAEAMKSQWEIVNEHWADDTPQFNREVRSYVCPENLIRVFLTRCGNYIYKFSSDDVDYQIKSAGILFTTPDEAIADAEKVLEQAEKDGFFERQTCDRVKVCLSEASDYLLGVIRALKETRCIDLQDKRIAKTLHLISVAFENTSSAYPTLDEYLKDIPHKEPMDLKEELIYELLRLITVTELERANKMIGSIKFEEDSVSGEHQITIKIESKGKTEGTNIDHLQKVIEMVKHDDVTVDNYRVSLPFIYIYYKREAS